MNIQNLYQELIMDHGREPRNFSKLDNASHSAEGHNPLCGDKIELFLRVQNDRIVAASFQGAGCAISMASASLMTETLLGKTLGEASLLFGALKSLLTQENISEDKRSDLSDLTDPNLSSSESERGLIKLGKLAALSGVRAFPSRVKCASLPWHTMLAALKNDRCTFSKISTE